MNQVEGKHGTTTVGVSYKDGVVLAADRRASLGHLAMHEDKKIVQITKYIGIATAGSVADIQILTRWLEGQMKSYKLDRDEEPTVDIAANLLSNVLFSGAKGFFPHMVMLMLGGKGSDGFKIFSLDMAGSAISDKFIAHGSGMELAYGVLEQGFVDHMTSEQAQNLAIKALTSAIRRDIGSGEGIDVAVIDKDGYREVKHIKYKDILR